MHIFVTYFHNLIDGIIAKNRQVITFLLLKLVLVLAKKVHIGLTLLKSLGPLSI